MTLFGTMDPNSLLYTYTPHNSTNTSIQVTGAPFQGVTLNGAEVIVQAKATINISGGGSIFSYAFQPDTAGLYDPFAIDNRYVILAGNSLQYPGDPVSGKTLGLGAVYLAGGDGIQAGVYSLLPEQYAFLPGAMVITPILTFSGASVPLSQQPLVLTQGYPVVGGYKTELGTNINNPQLLAYSVQTAAAVMQEGDFVTKNYIAGNAGTLTVTGTSVVLEGAVQSAPLTGYNGGTLVLSASNVIVQSEPIALPDGFNFSTSLPAQLNDKLVIADTVLNGKGLAEVDLGDVSTTNNVTITSGSLVDVPTIVLTAGNTINGSVPTITVQSGASLSGSNSVTLLAADTNTGNGIITIGDSASIHAGTSLAIEANSAALTGNFTIGQGGSTSLTSGQLSVFAAGSAAPVGGMSLTDALWNTLAGQGSLSLTSTSASGVTFIGDLNLAGGNAITINTPMLAATGQSTGGKWLNISAASINLLNSSANIGSTSLPPAGSAVFTANTITLGGNSNPTGQGQMLLDGFKTVTLASSGDLTMIGQGALSFGGWTGASSGQALVMTGARLVTAPYAYRDPLSGLYTYQTADFTLNGGNGAVSFSSGNGSPGATTWAGGSLQINGASISIAGIIDVPAGQINLTANGAGGIDLGQGAQILSPGVLAPTAQTGINTAYAGGTVSLTANNGPVTVEMGALIDVSAANQGAQGNAGTISLSATSPGTGVTLNGNIQGIATAGTGGSFSLDSNGSVDLTALNGILHNGGFTDQLNIRARQGNLELDSGGNNGTMTAQDIVLEADGTDSTVGNITGNIIINGTINALPDSSGNGGQVYLYAQNTLTVNGPINANAGSLQGNGGYVYLNSEGSNGFINQNGVINVSGGPNSGTGGTVYLRARQNTSGPNGAGVNIAMPGTIKGASQVVAEAFVVEQENSTSGYTINSTDMNAWLGAASTYINAIESSGNLPAGWNSQSPLYHFRPGIEIQNNEGDITLSSNMDLSPNSTTGLTYTLFKGEPGVLTLRAVGNLNINASLIDEPNGPTPLNSVTGLVLENSIAQPSWGFNLVAGADLAGANPLAVQPLAVLQQQGNGNITIADGVMVYTEKAPINFAAGNDMIVTLSNNLAGSMISPMISENMPFSLGTYDGEISGTVGNDLTLGGGIIESATGDIDIRIGGSLNLFGNGQAGTIRTTGQYDSANSTNNIPGEYPSTYFDYWNYQGGGNISLIAGNGILGQVNTIKSNISDFTPGWDMATTDNNGMLQWSACYVDLNDPYYTVNPTPGNSGVVATQGIATMGGGNITIMSGGDVTGQFGAFGAGPGNLLISAGGDLSGRFLVRNGVTQLTAGGNFAPLANAQINPVTGQTTTPAEGSLIEAFYDTIQVTAMGNVTLGTVANPTIASGDFGKSDSYNTSEQSSWDLDRGYENSSVGLTAVNGDVVILGATSLYSDNYSNSKYINAILPPTLNAYAGGSITLSSIPNGSSTPLPIAFAPSSNEYVAIGGRSRHQRRIDVIV